MKKLMLSLLLLYSTLAYSQESARNIEIHAIDSVLVMRSSGMDPASHTQLPKFIPPSPEVSSLFKFVDYPVSHSTGIPEISIPLYTVQCGNLSLPISIDYHASGRKFSDMTGAIGIGWNLNAGGTISRTVFGFPDESSPVPSNLRSASSLNIKDDYRYLAELYYKDNDPLGTTYDSEYDLFTYSLPGMSGSFVLAGGSPTPLTLNNVKISGTVNYFTIIGEDGTKYTFQSSATSSVSSPYNDYNSSVKTSWYLDRIESADGKHTINLTYESVRLYDNPGGNMQYSLMGETVIVKDMGQRSYQNMYNTIKYENASMALSFSSVRLKEINFGSGKVVFENEAVGGKLKKISIRDVSGVTVKTYSLTHDLLDHTLLDNYKLSSIATTSGSNQTDIYRFDYYPTSVSFASNQHDYWGYLNDNRTSMSNLLPAIEIPFNGYSEIIGHREVTRMPNENRMKSGVLKKITYPTGNSTEFIYEINKFMYVGEVRDCGGLRIRQIKTTDDAGQIQLRTFEYGRFGSLAEMQYELFWGYESLYLDVGSRDYPGYKPYSGHYRQRVFPSEFPQDFSYYANQPIFYSNVTEYKGDASNNTGKILYEYSNPYEGSHTNGIPPPTYSESYSYPVDYPDFMPRTFNYDYYSRYYRFVSCFNSLWQDRSLISQKEYARDNGVYNLIKSAFYNYANTTATPLTGLKIFKYIQIINDNDYHRSEELVAHELALPVFLFADYSITRGRRILSSVTENEVLDGRTVTVTRHYTYDSNFLLKSVTTSDSSGNNQSEETFYPTDAEYKDQAVYAKMVNLNMLNVPLRQTLTRNGKSRSNLTAYIDVGKNCIKPFELSTRKDNNAAEVRIRYNKYDNYGNPVHVVKDNVLNVVYLWGYNGMYPVAEITNATYSEVQAALGTVPESVSSSDTYDSRIDNLRAKLPQAQVTTYKYKRLVGRTSVTNPAGLTTFYTYDAFNRLQKISVQEPGGSIRTVGTHDYHYKNN